MVYLREPGQSSRGPSFRIHCAQLSANGLQWLVDKSVPRIVLHTDPVGLVPNCPGCESKAPALRELYLPAPPHSDIDATIDFHLTTRNVFAWLYNVPLTGRALGPALVGLAERLDAYRPSAVMKNKVDLVAYAELQRYLDFRECVDHALAALLFAEGLDLDDLWADAFAHCVGLYHHGLRTSLEYMVSVRPAFDTDPFS